MKLSRITDELPVSRAERQTKGFSFFESLRASRFCRAFSLVEVLMVVALLSLIILVLMAVFSSTQTAFRAGVTQTAVLESSRAAMSLIASDLKLAAPSQAAYSNNGVNFWVTNNYSYSTPLVQTLPGSSNVRSNLLQQIFFLNQKNHRWWGIGYAVVADSPSGLYSLYRLQYPPTAEGVADPTTLFTNQVVRNFFYNPTNYVNYTNGVSHLIDGVINFSVRAYDDQGIWITNGYYAMNQAIPSHLANNCFFFRITGNEVGFYMYSNVIPAAVEVQMGVLEDRVLQRAESLSGNATAQSNYLAQQSGHVYLFRQRVAIPNVDPTAYQ